MSDKKPGHWLLMAQAADKCLDIEIVVLGRIDDDYLTLSVPAFDPDCPMVRSIRV